MPARPYHKLWHALQVIPYTMPCPPGHTFSHVMPARPYHIPCHAHQAKPQTMPYPPGHTIYHAMPARTYHTMPRQAITYTMPCPPGHTIYLTMPTRSYYISCHSQWLLTQPYQKEKGRSVSKYMFFFLKEGEWIPKYEKELQHDKTNKMSLKQGCKRSRYQMHDCL